jgi:hypothetical protein
LITSTVAIMRRLLRAVVVVAVIITSAQAAEGTGAAATPGWRAANGRR